MYIKEWFNGFRSSSWRYTHMLAQPLKRYATMPDFDTGAYQVLPPISTSGTPWTLTHESECGRS